MPSVQHPNAYAFINGIEITSYPEIFNTITTYSADGTHTPLSYEPAMAYQIMCRFNGGG
jgi:hypothetical protein